MRELGAEAEAHHRDVGRVAGATGLDALFLLGEWAPTVAEGARAAGMPAGGVVVAGSHAELGTALAAFCRAGDLVLVKGSRGAAMEEVLRHLGPECAQ
jgi:UDP-N-acetylmuramoyl-tripeptide--D-alanyl-D-alanine ligase